MTGNEKILSAVSIALLLYILLVKKKCKCKSLNQIPVDETIKVDEPANTICKKTFVNYYGTERHVFNWLGGKRQVAMYNTPGSTSRLIPTYKYISQEEYNQACKENESGNFTQQKQQKL